VRLYYIAEPKATWAALICHTYQYYATSDCQTTSGKIPEDQPKAG